MLMLAGELGFEFGEIEPAALFAGFEPALGELDAFGSFEKVVFPWFVEDDVAKEHFPLDLEGVVVGLLFGHLAPSIEEVDRLLDVWIPDRAGGVAVVLHPHVAEANDGGTLGAVDLHGEQVVAADADVPR